MVHFRWSISQLKTRTHVVHINSLQQHLVRGEGESNVEPRQLGMNTTTEGMFSKLKKRHTPNLSGTQLCNHTKLEVKLLK